SKRGFPDQAADAGQVMMGGPVKSLIELTEESGQQPSGCALRFENESAESGSQRERVEGGQQHGYRNGEGKLPVNLSADAAQECNRYKDSGQNAGDGNHRPGDFLKSANGGIARIQAPVDIELYRLHHNDRVVNHDADCQHQTEQAGGVDGKAEGWEQGERADHSHWNRKQRNQSRAPVLEKDEDNQSDQQDRHKQ